MIFENTNLPFLETDIRNNFEKTVGETVFNETVARYNCRGKRNRRPPIFMGAKLCAATTNALFCQRSPITRHCAQTDSGRRRRSGMCAKRRKNGRF